VKTGQIRIGSRGSVLALAQAGLVRDALEADGLPSRIVVIQTEGDRRAPDTAWGEGAFVVAIERALLDGRVDAAVHSAKDVPTEEDPRLRIAAYLPRADPRDALVVGRDARDRRLDDLPSGSRVGTDSPRRTGFLLARRPDLSAHPLHGNVDTRLRRLETGETDALVLACAGLDRLGLGERIAERLEPDILPPAPGQGAIAVQVRRDDGRMIALASAIDDRTTRLAVEAERAFLIASGGGCRAPIGALATVDGEEIDLLGGYADPNGSEAALARRRGPIASGVELASELAASLGTRIWLEAGIAPIEPEQSRLAARRVLVTRAIGQADELVAALRVEGLEPVAVPTIAVESEPPRGDLDVAIGLLSTYDWAVVTSANGARAILEAVARIPADPEALRWAVIGPATRSVLEDEGIEIGFQPSRSRGSSMAAELPVATGERVLVVRGDLADERLAVTLRDRGAQVDDVIGYRTHEAPAGSRRLLHEAMAGSISAVVFTSGSTVRGLVTLGHDVMTDVLAIPSICIGPETAAEAAAAGFRILAISPSPSPATIAATTAGALALVPQEIA
jgi:hydroxymethylbilane synthase